MEVGDDSNGIASRLAVLPSILLDDKKSNLTLCDYDIREGKYKQVKQVKYDKGDWITYSEYPIDHNGILIIKHFLEDGKACSVMKLLNFKTGVITEILRDKSIEDHQISRTKFYLLVQKL